MKINNLPDYAKQHRFIVYRIIDGEKWFYGAYDDVSKVVQVCKDINGQAAELSDIDFI